MMKPIRKIVFPVAGLGTRFLPATKAMPKEMLPVVDKPLIQYAVEEAIAGGIDHFIFVTSRGKQLLEDHFDYLPELVQTLEARNKKAEIALIEPTHLAPGQLTIARQPRPKGLGHAVWCARNMVGDEPFALSLPDVLMHGSVSCYKQMIDVYNKHGGNVIALQEVPREHTHRYGIIKPGNGGASDKQIIEIAGLVEKPKPEVAPSTLSIVGRYILQPTIFDLLEQQEAGVGGEIQLTDAMEKMIGTVPFFGCRFAGTSFDCGDKAGFFEATLALAMEHPSIGQKAKELIKRYAASI